MNQFIAPTHPHETQARRGDDARGGVAHHRDFSPPLSRARASEIWGPGGAGWPDEPWWKLSGLFDRDYEHSVQAGVADLEAAMAAHGNDDLVIYGYSQGATVAIAEKRKLAAQYPSVPRPPISTSCWAVMGICPTAAFFARFPGLYVPILDLSFNGPEPTNTPFDTVVITRQYDGAADFPLYPLNLISPFNALLGAFYVHLYGFDVSLAPDPSTSTPSPGHPR